MTDTLHNAASTPARHIPVMLAEVLACLAPKDGGVYVDGTFGAGGYTRAILESANCTVYGIDRDPEAIARAQAFTRDFAGRFHALHGCFGDAAHLLAGAGVESIDGFVLDLGVSSIQLGTASRGFSFQHDGPLDMRMSLSGESAADIVNTADEKELADIIYTYGEERAARRIAKAIVEARREKPIETTAALAAIIHRVLPMHGGMKTDTATRSFQALRIHVNDEMGEIDRALDAAPALLKDGGRLVVVSFHSLEDWRVKTYLREQSGEQAGTSRHLPPDMSVKAAPVFKLEKRNGLAPSDAETAANPRARSARLRYAIRTDAPLQSAARRAGGRA
ncbi:MAG: 16S rRNA (cytosine(1402)-N(4))-methyltransferase RsmH [Alphaproteobacteria bacterium]|nr:16S rRNA (cytosine(1402)-N(4))-methyltransferase RsmH [Alphaproteobacteria bacterium]